jgi:hypothetical protein
LKFPYDTLDPGLLLYVCSLILPIAVSSPSHHYLRSATMSKSHVVVITFRNAQGRTECYIRISLEKAESQGRLVVDSLGRKRRLNSGIAHGLPTACSQTAHGPLMGVKRAMIGGTRKNADLKQPSRVSFVD